MSFLCLYINDAQTTSVLLVIRLTTEQPVIHYAVKGSSAELRMETSLPFSQQEHTAALYLPDPPVLWVWSIWTPLSESYNNKASPCQTCTPSKGI